MKKRLFSMLLAIALLFSIGVSSFASEEFQIPEEFIFEPEADNTGIIVAPPEEASVEIVASEIIPDIPVEQSIETYVLEDPAQENSFSQEQSIIDEEVLSGPVQFIGGPEASVSDDNDQQYDKQDVQIIDISDNVTAESGSESSASVLSEIEVVFKVVPEWAEIHVFQKINEENVEIDPIQEKENTFLLLPGEYTFTAEAYGYHAVKDEKFVLYKDRLFVEETYQDLKDPIMVVLDEVIVEEQFQIVESSEILPDIPGESLQQQEDNVSFDEVSESASLDPSAEIDSDQLEDALASEELDTGSEAVNLPEVNDPSTHTENTEIAATSEKAEEESYPDNSLSYNSEPDADDSELVTIETVDSEAKETQPVESETSSTGGFFKWLFTGASSKEDRESEDALASEELDTGSEAIDLPEENDPSTLTENTENAATSDKAEEESYPDNSLGDNSEPDADNSELVTIETVDSEAEETQPAESESGSVGGFFKWLLTGASSKEDRESDSEIAESADEETGEAVEYDSGEVQFREALFAAGNFAITAQPQSVTVAHGETATFTVEATGEGLSYAWYYNNPKTNSKFYKSSNTTATYSVTADEVKHSEGFNVYCVVKDASGSTLRSETATMTVGTVQEFAITSQPQSVTVAHGETATFTVEATGEGLSYAWYYNNPKTNSRFYKSSNTTPTYSVTADAAKHSEGFNVYCVVKDASGSTLTSETATMTVGAVQEFAITSQPQSVTVAHGETATFTVEATGEGLSYAWYYNNPKTNSKFYKSSNTSATYSVIADEVKHSEGFNVYCVVKDASGSTLTSETATMTLVSGIQLISDNFPSPGFLAAVSVFDEDENGYLSDAEIAEITVLDCSNRDIDTLEGIAYLTALQSLNCSNNSLTSVDVSGNLALTTLVCSNNANLTSVTFAPNMTGISANAFSGCTGLTQFTIPPYITTIDNSAFEGCTSLTSVTMSDNVSRIGQAAFKGCTSLSNISISD